MIDWQGHESAERFGAAEAGKYESEDVLRFLAKHQGQWSTWGKGYSMPTIGDAMPGASDGAQWRKARNLFWWGLIGGCPCGCRGDFEITDLGLACIGLERTKPYTGYGHKRGSMRPSDLELAMAKVRSGEWEVLSVTGGPGPPGSRELKMDMTFGPKETSDERA